MSIITTVVNLDKSTSNEAAAICKKTQKPNAATAAVLSKLFGKPQPCKESKKHSFDPRADCIVASKLEKKNVGSLRYCL